MTLNLTPEDERLIAERIASGRFDSGGEVVRVALELLRQRESFRQAQIEELRREIQVGIDAAGRGEVVDGEEAFRSLRERHQRLVSGGGDEAV